MLVVLTTSVLFVALTTVLVVVLTTVVFVALTTRLFVVLTTLLFVALGLKNLQSWSRSTNRKMFALDNLNYFFKN